MNGSGNTLFTLKGGGEFGKGSRSKKGGNRNERESASDISQSSWILIPFGNVHCNLWGARRSREPEGSPPSQRTMAGTGEAKKE